MALLTIGRGLAEAERRDNLLTAETLKEDEFNKIERRLNLGYQPEPATDTEDDEEPEDLPTDYQLWCLERTKIELFYREVMSDRLLDFDDHGRGRRAIMEFERFVKFLAEDKPVSSFASRVRSSDVSMMSRHLRVGVERTKLLHLLLSKTPIIQNNNEFGLELYSQRDLSDFIRLLKSHKPAVETLLELEVRNDASPKAVMIINNILEIIGLRHEQAKRVKEKGKTIYYYRLEPESLDDMRAFVSRRQEKYAWAFLAETYGWKRFSDEE